MQEEQMEVVLIVGHSLVFISCVEKNAWDSFLI